jgi:hypothetical protein
MARRSTLLWGAAQAIGLALGAAAVYAYAIRPWHLRWGTIDDEPDGALPGDELVPNAKLCATHAVSIDAPVEQVWPWLVQIGQGRGGFYSYEFIENALGADIHNTDQILPEFQDLKVGDQVPLAQGGFGIPVAILDAPRTLVLHGDSRTAPDSLPGLRPGDYFNVVWGWHLEAIDDLSTRLIERWLADWNPSMQNFVFMRAFLEPGAFIMSRKMLLGIKQRASKTRIFVAF